MFTMRQIALAGFLGVYSGCLPLTVNLARIPYRRGAVVGVFFSALTHMMITLLYILIAIYASQWMNDPMLAKGSTWLAIAAAVLVIQVLTSVGCLMMGGYFLAPARKSDIFDRQKLYDKLKKKDLLDNPEDGSRHKRSVMHDVVVQIENSPALPDVRFSSAWIVFFGFLSLFSTISWLKTLNLACLEVLFLGAGDFGWYFGIAMHVFVPFVMLILAHFSVMAWLCRDKA